PTTAVTGIISAVHVSAAGGFTCALLSSGNVECWGSNNLGQLGIGAASTNPVPTPAPVHW
ncbi:MAG: hypothetical protein JOZ69_03690, partial [Myxococcales bacterium]|nr:hypothetical protein [Myxococcales bacterium]